MNLFIYGSGGTGCEVADIARRSNMRKPEWGNLYFVDDFRSEQRYYELRVFDFEEMLRETEPYACVIAQGEPRHRKILCDKLVCAGVRLGTVIDPSAVVSPSARIGSGCIIWPGVFVSSLAILDSNVMVQINSVIGHDTTLGSHSVISSGVSIGGGTSVGEEVFVGMGASVREKIRVGDYAIVGMGASLFINLEANLIALGNPARVVQRNIERKVFK
jgi:sugar O-acyltransferase (sialic acid O-acetyltransferase NeuD family)